MEEAIDKYEINITRFGNELQRLAQSLEERPLFGFPPRGLFEIPAVLRSFHSRIGQDGANANIAEIEEHSHGFLYHHDSLDETRLSKHRSQIVRFVKLGGKAR